MSWPTTTGVEEGAAVERPPGIGDGSPPLRRYTELKAALLEALDGLAGTHRSGRVTALELKAKLAAERFTLAIVGEFKRGKTSLVNALLGKALLPMGVVPLTSAATAIAYGEDFAASVRFHDGRRLSIGRADIAAYATEAGNPGNAKGVREVRVEFPAPLLKDGLELLDTPGVGSIHGHNTAAAHAVLPRCDAALFVLSADQPLGRAELEFLENVRGHARRIFFLLNKIDYLDEAELVEVLGFTRAALAEALGTAEVRLFPVSARLALKGGSWVDAGLREQSRLPAFAGALEEFLLNDKGKLLLLGAADGAARLLAAARLELEIARKSLAEPPAVLEARLHAFRGRRERLAAERRRLVLDFETRVGRLVETCLDPGLATWRSTQEARLRRRFQSCADECRERSPRALDDALAAFMADETTAAAAVFRAGAEPAMEAEFGRAGRILAAGIGALLEELQGFAAGLFQLEGPAPEAEAAWVPGSRSTLAWGAREDDPAGLELLSELAATDWPAWLGRRFPKLEAALLRWSRRRIVERRRRQLPDAIDLVLGRIRHDFLARLEDARRRYSAKVLRWHDSVAEGLALAMEQGLEERRRSADFLEGRHRALDRQLAQWHEQARRVEAVRRDAESL